jgi:hypothetical protein
VRKHVWTPEGSAAGVRANEVVSGEHPAKTMFFDEKVVMVLANRADGIFVDEQHGRPLSFELKGSIGQ